MAGTSGAIRAGRAFVELFVDNSKLNQGLRKAVAKLKAFGQSASTLGRSILTTAAIAAFPLVMATRTFREFDDEMRFVQATSQAVGEQFDMLTRKARLLGKTTSFTAQQVASSMAELGRGGFSPQQIDDSIDGMLTLARATRESLPTATNIALKALRAFELETSQATEVVDLLVATVNNSTTTLPELGEALRFVSQSAHNLNMSLKDTLLIIGSISSLGLASSVAGTSTNQLLMQITKADKIKKLEGLIGSVQVLNEETGKMDLRSPVELLSRLTDAFAAMGTIQREQVAYEVFGLRGSRSAKGFANAGEALVNLREAFENVTGTAKKASDAMDAGVGGVWRRLISAFQEMQISLGKRLEPVLIHYGTRIKEIINDMSLWISRNRETVVSITGLILKVGALGAAILALGMIAGAVSNLAFLLPSLMSPVGSVIVTLGALAFWVRTQLLQPIQQLNDELAITNTRTKEIADLFARLNPKKETALSPEEKALSGAQKLRAKYASQLAAAQGDLDLAQKALGKAQKEQVLELPPNMFDAWRPGEPPPHPLVQAVIDAQKAVSDLEDAFAQVDRIMADAANRKKNAPAMAALTGSLTSAAPAAAVMTALTNAMSPAAMVMGALGGVNTARIKKEFNPVLAVVQAHEDALNKIRAQGMAEGLGRTFKLIDLEYERRIRKAKEANQDTAALEAAWRLKRSQARDKEWLKEKRDKQSLVDDIARLQIQADKEGLAERLALLDEEEARTLRDAKGKDEQLIRDAFNLRREIAEQDAAPQRLQFAAAEFGQRSNAAQAAWIRRNFGGKPDLQKRQVQLAERADGFLERIAGKEPIVIQQGAIP